MINTSDIPDNTWLSVVTDDVNIWIWERAENVNWILEVKWVYGNELDITSVDPSKFFVDMRKSEMIWVPNLDSKIIYYVPKWSDVADTLKWSESIEGDECIKVTWFHIYEWPTDKQPALCVKDWHHTLNAIMIWNNHSAN